MSECALCNIVLEVGDDPGIELLIDADEGLDIDLGDSVIYVTDVPYYTGSYEFTPTAEVQIVPTTGKAMLDDIRINPIPNNYGLVTYNGSIITIT